MRESKTYAENKKSSIQCVEVLISKTFLTDAQDNLFWTLTVYSLENQPVSRQKSVFNSEVFHFMVYDWQRTIRQLLDKHQISYSIIQYFATESICPVASTPPQNNVIESFASMTLEEVPN